MLVARAHLAPVLDGVADVAEDRGAVPISCAPVGGHPVDLEVHPRLGDDAEVVRGRVLVVIDVLQRPHGVAPDHELRVDDQVDGTAGGCRARP